MDRTGSQKEGGAVVMAVTTAPARAGTLEAWISSGGFYGRRRAGKPERTFQSSELPLGSLDGHYNFVDAYHVEPAPRSHLDCSRVAFQLLNFQPQGFITASQCFNIG